MKKILMGTFISGFLAATCIAEVVSSYEYANFKSSADVKSALKKQGMEVVGEYDAMNNPNYHIIAYTCPTLKKDASQQNRGFAAVEKIMLDKTQNRLVMTNPEYFLHAFMQDDYKEAHGKKVNEKLQDAFGTLKGSKDGLDADEIAEYHFMMGMPYYEDMIEVAEGENLKQKLETNAKNNIVFKIESENATLYGVAMPTQNGEAYYVSEINGQKHAAFLPYMVLIEDHKAKILHPKYYLAIAYPNLSMGDFMSISGTPADIEEYIAGMFQ
jgi:hypothetical protein